MKNELTSARVDCSLAISHFEFFFFLLGVYYEIMRIDVMRDVRC